MSFGTTFTDEAAAMEGEDEEHGAGFLAGAAEIMEDPVSIPSMMVEDFPAYAASRTVSEQERIEAHAVNQAHAAFRSAGARIGMNIVLSAADAARVLAFRVLYETGHRIIRFAHRIAPTR